MEACSDKVVDLDAAAGELPPHRSLALEPPSHRARCPRGPESHTQTGSRCWGRSRRCWGARPLLVPVAAATAVGRVSEDEHERAAEQEEDRHPPDRADVALVRSEERSAVTRDSLFDILDGSEASARLSREVVREFVGQPKADDEELNATLGEFSEEIAFCAFTNPSVRGLAWAKAAMRSAAR